MSEDQKPFFIPEKQVSADERLVIAELTVVRLMEVLKSNRIPANEDTVATSETREAHETHEILWRRFTPIEYVASHAAEFGQSSPRLMEARAIIAFLEGNVPDGLFLCAALVHVKARLSQDINR